MWIVSFACTPIADPADGADRTPAAWIEVAGEAAPAASELVTGGRIAVSADGSTTVGAESAAITVTSGSALATVFTLPSGWDPGQVAVDGDRAWVVLRGLGAVLPLDLEAPAAGAPIPVCAEPRGIGASGDGVAYVACADGALVEVDEREVVHVAVVADDLRDVVVDGDEIWVTRFRSAEVLRVDRRTARITSIAAPVPVVSTGTTYAPRVAWRMIANPDGGVIVVDQLHQVDPVVGGAVYYGPPDPNVCGGVVLGRVRYHRADGAIDALPPFAAAVPYDLAVLPDGALYVAAFGAAGWQDGSILRVVDAGGPCAELDVGSFPAGASIAVRDGAIVAGARGVHPDAERFYASGTAVISCASCHADGRDDGHVWALTAGSPVPVRTPTLAGPLLETAPYHWSGGLPDLEELWGGTASLMGLRVDLDGAVTGWLAALRRPVPAPVDPAEVAQGEAIFGERCAECHPPPLYTDNRTLDVGTGGRFQVPSLLGVAARLPLMHDGCAGSLLDALDAACAGDEHGLADLDDEERGLVRAFLASL